MILLTQFEKAYIALYNDRITAPEFAEAAGIPDKEEAWAQLCAYRKKVLNGEIPDPRDKYNKWRRPSLLNKYDIIKQNPIQNQ